MALIIPLRGKTVSLVKRLGGEKEYIMTGGVARNKGIVAAIEEKLGAKLFISEDAQLCGAIGAALIGLESLTEGMIIWEVMTITKEEGTWPGK